MNGSLALVFPGGDVCLIYGTYEDAVSILEGDPEQNIFVITTDANVDEFKPPSWWDRKKLVCMCYAGPHGGYTCPGCS